MKDEHGLPPDKELVPDGETPFAGCTAFAFRSTKLPELILRIDRAGGILVAADALQNWVSPNEFFSDETQAMMTEMGFFQSANLGPLWMQVNEPKADDFARLRQLSFRQFLRARRAAARRGQGCVLEPGRQSLQRLTRTHRVLTDFAGHDPRIRSLRGYPSNGLEIDLSGATALRRPRCRH